MGLLKASAHGGHPRSIAKNNRLKSRIAVVGSYSLSVLDEDVQGVRMVKHYRIRDLDNGGVYISPRQRCDDMVSLIQHYMGSYRLPGNSSKLQCILYLTAALHVKNSKCRKKGFITHRYIVSSVILLLNNDITFFGYLLFLMCNAMLLLTGI